MKVLVINSGSSSIKYQLIEMPKEEKIISGRIERIGFGDSIFVLNSKQHKVEKIVHFENHESAIKYLITEFLELELISSINEIDACGHRIAHGGEYFKESSLINEITSKEIEKLFPLAPLHNPANLNGYMVLSEELPHIKHVGVFDTAFHQTMEEEIFLYPLPIHHYKDLHIRKYGFHGTSYQYVSSVARELLGKDKSKRLIVCHLGNGASLCAIKDGMSINTSMGLTPLGGIMMGTRSGDIDPGIVRYICDIENTSVGDMINILNEKSGVLGLSGVSNDMRDVKKAAKEGNEQAKIALDVYARRVVDYIGSYAIQLGGVDALIFTAGIGENDYVIRHLIIERVKELLGIEIDEIINENTVGTQAKLSTINSKVEVFVIPTNEEIMIAKDTYQIIDGIHKQVGLNSLDVNKN